MTMSASAPRADAAPALAGVDHGHSISIDFADPDGTPDEITT